MDVEFFFYNLEKKVSTIIFYEIIWDSYVRLKTYLEELIWQ